MLFDAGREVRSDKTMIDHTINTGTFAQNPSLMYAIDRIKMKNTDKQQSTDRVHADARAQLHVLGIVSDGNVHASLQHMEALLTLCAARGLKGDQVSVHMV